MQKGAGKSRDSEHYPKSFNKRILQIMSHECTNRGNGSWLNSYSLRHQSWTYDGGSTRCRWPPLRHQLEPCRHCTSSFRPEEFSPSRLSPTSTGQGSSK